MRVYFCSRSLWVMLGYSHSHQWVFAPLFVDVVLTVDIK